jgi:membrane protein
MIRDDPTTPPDPPRRRRAPSGASLGELLRSLAADATLLVRQEVALVRAELRATVRGIARATAAMGGGAVALLLSLLTLLAALVLGLGVVIGSYWLAALAVGLVLAAVGGALVFLGLRTLRTQSPTPQRTLRSLSVTGGWAGEEARRVWSAVRAPAPTGDGKAATTPALPVGTSASGASPTTPVRVLRATPDPASASAAERQERRREGLDETSASGGGRAAAGQKAFWTGVKEDFTGENVPGLAAQVAYYAFLSLPPALMVVFALTGLVGGEPVAAWLTEQLTGVLPGEVSGLVEGFVHQVVFETAPGPLSIGLVLALWAASNVFVALADALNRAYEVRPRGSWIRKRLTAVGVMLGAVLLFILGSAALLAGPAITQWIGIGSLGATVWSLLQWPLAFALVVGAFWIVYFFLPARDQWAEKTRILKGAAAGAALWLLATMGFRLYIENFGQYTETYGFLGTIIVLLLWLYITSLVVILGGIVNSRMSRPGAGA